MFLAVISLIAVTNLAVGYALGKLGVFDAVASPLAALLQRRAAEPELELPIEESLTAPAPEPVAPPPPEPAPPQPEASVEPPTAAAPEPEAAPAPAAKPEPPPGPAKKPSTADLMGGLASFRDKLSAASVELKLNREDESRFDSSATKLQEVNHDYLDHVSTTIERLDELDAEGDRVARAAKSAVSENAKEAEEMSGQIDSLIENGLDGDSRAELIEKSAAMRDAAATTSSAAEKAVERAEGEAAEAAAQAAASASEKATESLGKLFEQLDTALNDAADAVGDEAEVLVAEVRTDKLEEVDDPAAIEAAVLRELAVTADNMLGESQAFFAGDRCLMLLAGDAFDAAAKRMEEFRQQMQAIEYERDGQKVHATVTCGLVEAHLGEGREAVENRLAEALAEANRLGANRTFHHDGAFPTPIPEMQAEPKPRTVAV